MHRLRHKLSGLRVRRKGNIDEKRHDPDALPRDEDAVSMPTGATLDDSDSPATVTTGPESPSPPPPPLHVSTTTTAMASPPTPVTPSPSKRELSWRERRLTTKPVPASIVHAYSPRPKPKLTTLPPELLHAVFLYLQGDPTRPDNVAYRASEAGQDDAAHWYSHSWSLMQVARSCSYLRAVAAPLLYSGAALLVKDDFARLAKASESLRARVRHLTVSISALEHLYVFLTILHLAHVDSSSPTGTSEFFPGVYLHPRSDGKKPIVRGSPFARALGPDQLTRLTLFRPRGESQRSGEAVLRGFSAFFADALQYWTELEALEVRDQRGEWHLPLDAAAEEGDVRLEVKKLRRLKWDVALPLPAPPCLASAAALRSLFIGAHVPLPPPSQLSVPAGLETLHILALNASTRLPALPNLRDLRVSLPAVTSAVLDALHLPPALEMLHLSVPALPNVPALARAVSHLASLRVLLLSLPDNPAVIAKSRSPAPPSSSPASDPQTSPDAAARAACETLATHVAHRALAKRVMDSARAVREVRVGACVWGRADCLLGDVEICWVDERTRMGIPVHWD